MESSGPAQGAGAAASAQGGSLNPPSQEAVETAQDVLVQLDKAIRVFRMYDSSNDLVTKFLSELEVKMRRYLDKYGDFIARIRPAAFDYQGEQITKMGLDEFALAMFRQGLTALRISRDVEMEGLKEFLSQLSIGLLGGEEGDDDLVTLLWRAEIPGVSYSSVLGYQELGEDEEVEQEYATPDAVRSALMESMLSDLEELSADTTGVLAQKASLLKQEGADLSPELRAYLAPLDQETGSDLQLYLLEIVGESLLSPVAAEHLSDEEVRDLLRLLLGWLCAAGRIDNVSRFVGFLQFLLDPSASPSFHFAGTVQGFMQDGMTEEQLRGLIQGLPGGINAHLDAVTAVVGTLGRPHKDVVADLIGQATDPQAKHTLERLLLSLCQEDPAYLMDRFKEASSRQIPRALTVLGAIGPEHAQRAIADRLGTDDPQIQIALLQALAEAPTLYDSRMRETLGRIGRAGGRLRTSVVEVFTRAGDAEAASVLWRWSQAEDFDGWEPVDLKATFRGLMKLSSEERTLAFLEEILTRKSLLGRQKLARTQTAVVDALEEHGSAGAIGILKRHGTEGHKWLREPCNAALARLAARSRTGRP